MRTMMLPTESLLARRVPHGVDRPPDRDVSSDLVLRQAK